MPTKKKTELPEEMTTPLEAQEPQTEEDTTALPAEGVPDDACDTSLSQTETDSAEAEASSAGIPDGALNEPTESQTEVKKTRRRKKTEPEPSQSDTEPENAPNAKEYGVDAASKPKRKRAYTKPSVSVLSIDDRPTVETEADKAKNDLLDLIESQRSGRILTGTIQGVEQSADNPRHAFAVLYHGEFKVIIPAAEAVEPPEDYRGRDPDEVLHYMLTKRLGAEVDYIVKGIDPVLQRRAVWKPCVPVEKKCISAQTGTATTVSMPVFAQKPELSLPSVPESSSTCSVWRATFPSRN